MVRALHYITGRLPVLIQAVCFCPSGECAPTLFKSSESKSTISNKQNNSHRASQNFTPRGPTPLAASMCERIILQKGHITFYICLQSPMGAGAKSDFRTNSKYPTRYHSFRSPISGKVRMSLFMISEFHRYQSS